MKKLSLLLLVITITASSFAKTNKGATIVRKIATDEIVTSLKIYNNVEVILTNDESNDIQIVGEKATVENITVKISNGELTISGYKDGLFKENVVVYVPAKTLAGIYIHGSSTVSSSGTISNEMLDVTINGEGRSNIKTAGRINLNTIGDFPLGSF